MVSLKCDYFISSSITMSKLKNTIAALAVASSLNAQVALDKTVTNTEEQIYKTIAFANGSENYNPHPSYSVVGPKNIAYGVSDFFGGGPSIWRNDENGGTFVGYRSAEGYPTESTTVEDVTVGGHTISWEEAYKMIYESEQNDLGINYFGKIRTAMSDVNGDGLWDAKITTYTLPAGQEALDQGFQVGDVAIFSTPTLLENPGSGLLLTNQVSYKVLTDELVWEDTTTFSPDYPEYDIIDWIEEGMATSEVEQLKTVVYPNPATEAVYIRTDGMVTEAQLINLSGQRVRHLTNLPHNGKDTTIDLNGIAPGGYVLQIRGKDGKVESRKIIKN